MPGIVFHCYSLLRSVRLCVLTLTLLTGAVFSQVGCERTKDTEPPRIGLLPEGAAKPDLILIVIDALRADRLGVYGHPGGLSPTIDAIAAEGVTFDYCVATAPWTAPSMASLFISYYPGVHKTTKYRVVSKDGEKARKATQSVLSDEFHTLAEVLALNGYQTAGFCANTMLRKRQGFAQGFEYFNTRFAANTVRGELVNRAAFEWFERDRDPNRPLFMYLHYMDVHGPYDAAQRFMDPLVEPLEAELNKQALTDAQWKRLRGYLRKAPPGDAAGRRYQRLNRFREYWVARYEAGVAEGDFYLGQLVQGLKERGLWDDAYKILISDHGEALCTHGLWDHGHSQHQDQLHVPLILHWPKVLPAGKRISRLASLIDILPTLIEQLHLAGGEHYQGVSLVDHLSGTLPPAPLTRFAEADKFDSQYALFRGRTKLIVSRTFGENLIGKEAGAEAARPRLYDLDQDASEASNLAPEQTETVAELIRLINEAVRANQSTKPGIIAQQAPVSPEMVEKLRALGYVGGAQEDEEDENP